VAGNSTPGFTGDGGAATSAELQGPHGVAVDAAGNVYIADLNNYRIRKVAAGIITTVAGKSPGSYSGDGGAATNALLDLPWGVSVDNLGNFYIADLNNGRIREVTAAGVITTVAGNGTAVYSGDGGAATSAGLDSPEGVAVDNLGNMYIADFGDNRIRVVGAPSAPIAIPGSGIINTIVGNGTAGYSGDGRNARYAELSGPAGVAVDSLKNVYIADTNNNRIRKVTASTGVITTIAGNGTAGFSGDGSAATSAKLNSPSGVAVDSSGNVYIADTNNNRIRKVTVSTGVITTVAGNGTAGFFGDGGTATSAEVNGPFGVSLDSAGDIYIADTNNNRIRVVNTGSTNIMIGGVSIAPTNIASVAGDGTTSGPVTLAPALSTGLNKPYGVVGTPSSGPVAGHFYIADTQHCAIRRVFIVTDFMSLDAGDSMGACAANVLNLPRGVALDGSGNLCIADTANELVRKTAGLGGPNSLFTTAGTGTAGFSGDGGLATSAKLNNPNGVAMDSAGNIYIADTNNNRIRVVGH